MMIRHDSNKETDNGPSVLGKSLFSVFAEFFMREEHHGSKTAPPKLPSRCGRPAKLLVSRSWLLISARFPSLEVLLYAFRLLVSSRPGHTAREYWGEVRYSSSLPYLTSAHLSVPRCGLYVLAFALCPEPGDRILGSQSSRSRIAAWKSKQ